MLTSLPEPPRPRSRLTELAQPVDGPPYRNGAEVVTADGRSLPLVSATLRGTARGGIARLMLEQRFENRHAQTLHVTYRMPLPADGAVSGYEFGFAGRTIVGRVQRKQQARERFERAIAAGHTAALLEQERADIFTQSIGNLPANEALTARITIDLRLTWLPEGEWELRFPTVIGPRYVAASDRPEDVRGTQVATAPGGVAARIRIAIAIRDELASGRTPSSPSHALATGADGATELRDLAGARLDRDLVLRWPVAGPTTGMSLAMMRPERSDDCFGLVTIVPPAPTARPRALPRDLIVLIDTSGSMTGRPLDKARQVIALLIESLGDDDRLELIEFSSEPRRYKPAPVTATRSEKRDAIRWLHKLSAGGGTEMRTAVIAALQLLRPGAQRQVVIATDGYLGGEDRLVAALHAGLPRSCRLHFVGIGSSVNRSLATAMARAGRGAEVICDLDADAERPARRLLDRTRSPVLTDITLDGSAVIARAPDAVPDVYAGSPVVAAVRLGAGELVVRARTADGVWERRLRVGMPRPGDGDPAIAALFGRERIADLEARGVAGEDCDAEIELTGLAFQIATRFTPFVAIDESRKVHPAVHHRAVPQELPYGTTAAAFGLRPATAAAVDGVPDPMASGVDTGRISQILLARASAVPADADDLVGISGEYEVDEAPRERQQAAEPSEPVQRFAMRAALDGDPGDDDFASVSRRRSATGPLAGPTFYLDEDPEEFLGEDRVFPGEEDEKEIADSEDFGEVPAPELFGEAPESGALGAGSHAPASPGDGFARPPRPTEAAPWVARTAGPPPDAKVDRSAQSSRLIDLGHVKPAGETFGAGGQAPGSPTGGSERTTEPRVMMPTIKSAGAPSGPPDPRADRRSRVQRILKPRGLASIRRGEPTMPVPPGGPPATGPMKTVFHEPPGAATSPVTPAPGARDETIEPRPAAIAVDEPRQPRAPGPRPSSAGIELRAAALHHRRRPGDAPAPGVSPAIGEPVQRSPWPVWLAVLAIPVLLAVLLLWWLVG